MSANLVRRVESSDGALLELQRGFQLLEEIAVYNKKITKGYKLEEKAVNELASEFCISHFRVNFKFLKALKELPLDIANIKMHKSFGSTTVSYKDGKVTVLSDRKEDSNIILFLFALAFLTKGNEPNKLGVQYDR